MRRREPRDTQLMICSACLTEACAAGTLMCEDSRTAGLIFTTAAGQPPSR